jgi:hypothetical protein
VGSDSSPKDVCIVDIRVVDNSSSAVGELIQDGLRLVAESQ